MLTLAKRIACIIGVLIVLAALGGPGGAALAQDAGPTMRVTAGFDGYCRSGCWCPLYVVLSNEGADVEGELSVLVPSTWQDISPGVYTQPVVLPAHSRKAYMLSVPSVDPSYHPDLTVRLLIGGRTFLSRPIRVQWLDEGERLYGVASGDPSALNLLSGVAPVGEQAAVAHLDLEALPPAPLAWEGLDVVVLNDVDTSALTPDQRLALGTWLAHGGHLVVGGGAGVARTVAGVADLLPVTVGGVRAVDDLPALGEPIGAATVAGPYPVAEAGLRDGVVLIEQREQGEGGADLTLLARRTHGAGTVDFLAFDAGLRPFARWDDNGRLWTFILGEGMVRDRTLTVQRGSGMKDAVNLVPGLDLPSVLQIVGFMLVYTLLIGPVNYLVLRKLDRRELAWLTIPALVVGFTVGAYLTGFFIRGNKAVVHRLATVYVPEASPAAPAESDGVGRVTQAVGLFSPRRVGYDLRVPDSGVRELPGEHLGRPLRVVEGVDGWTVNDLRVDVGGVQPFMAEGYAPVPSVEADLRLVGDVAGPLELKGTLRNGEVPLEGAVLLAGDREQRLGDLAPGQDAAVAMLMGGSLPPGEEMAERILGLGSYWDDPERNRRYQFLRALFPAGDFCALDSGMYLVGWSEEVPLPVEVLKRPASTADLALYVYALPVVGLEDGGAVTIPPDLFVRRLEESTGYPSTRSESFYLDAGEMVVFGFVVRPRVTLRHVDDLVVEIQGQGSGPTVGAPVVSLWHRERGDWERVDMGWERYTVPDAGAYVAPSGYVRMRLEAPADGSVDVTSLHITIRGRR